MQAHQFHNLRKAARAGLSWSNDAATWAAGIDHIAKSAQRRDETFEAAYSRVVQENDDARAMMAMYRAAAAEAEAVRKGGRPRTYEPGTIQRGKIEKALSEAAMQIAQAESVSYESAFCKVLDTAAGRDLYSELRRLESL